MQEQDPPSSYEYDPAKDATNQAKHGVAFIDAERAFLDPRRLIVDDDKHGGAEPRYFCLGKVDGRVMTVRFTYRDEKIRIFGAGYWRAGRKRYEQEHPRKV